MNSQIEAFEQYRPLMFGIAYRMLGSAMEAEDIVQDAYLRYQATGSEHIESPRAFLSTVVTRLCLDHLKSAKVQRETYIGPWLPEPLSSDSSAQWVNPASQISARESISMAFLVLLESLSPAERAVFLLREVFDYDYSEIARIVGKEEAACRQLFSRAKKHISDHRPRFEPSPQVHEHILAQFLQTVQAGDMAGMEKLLAEDITMWSDGGGKVAAATRPVHGRAAVAKLLMSLPRLSPEGVQIEIAPVNGLPAVVTRLEDGTVFFVFTIELQDGLIHAFRIIGNPDKLRYLQANQETGARDEDTGD